MLPLPGPNNIQTFIHHVTDPSSISKSQFMKKAQSIISTLYITILIFPNLLYKSSVSIFIFAADTTNGTNSQKNATLKQ
ncbi:hypothetical protein Hanom_Chr11g01009211 [Helianthus anomalus]